MASMDSGVPNVRRYKPVTKAELKRLKESGQKADLIKKDAEKHHQEKELPEAENFLEEELKKM